MIFEDSSRLDESNLIGSGSDKYEVPMGGRESEVLSTEPTPEHESIANYKLVKQKSMKSDGQSFLSSKIGFDSLLQLPPNEAPNRSTPKTQQLVQFYYQNHRGMIDDNNRKFDVYRHLEPQVLGLSREEI